MSSSSKNHGHYKQRTAGSRSRSSSKSESPPVMQPPTAPEIPETPEAPLPQWPPWLENLLSVVHYNFAKGLVFFCISCNKGLFQETHFDEGADHHSHDRLRMYEYESSICVNWADLEALGVNTSEIQEFTRPVPDSEVEDHGVKSMFVHNTFGYAYADFSIKPWENCANCRTRLKYVQVYTTTRFCCLDCKVQYYNRVIRHRDRIALSSSPKLVSPRRTQYKVHFTNLTFAEMISKGYKTSSESTPQKSDDSESHKAHGNGNDEHVNASSVNGEDDLAIALYEYMALLAYRGATTLQRMSEHYGSLHEVNYGSDGEIDITSVRRADLDSTFETETISDLWSEHAKIVDLEESEHDSHSAERSPAASELETMQSPNNDAGEQEVDTDQIGCQLPGVLYEDDQVLHQLLSPSEEFMSSMDTTWTPPMSPTRTFKEVPNVSEFESPKVISCADSKLDSKMVELESLQTTVDSTMDSPVTSFRAALAAASSCSSKKLWPSPTPGVTKGDLEAVDHDSGERGPDGVVMENVEGLGVMPKSTDDNILKKAAYLLRSFGTRELENEHHDRVVSSLDDREDDTNSIQASSSPEEDDHLEPDESFPIMASPEVVSFKVQGSVDFKSLKQLAATFDPQRWAAEARSCTDLVPFKLPPAAAPVL
ncbi:unnamed protein product [Calypogeia fissa]